MKKYLQWLRQTKKKGFSLIELSIVITLLAILVFISHAQLTFLNRMMVRAELEHMYTVCYYLQRRALMLNKPQTLTFDCAARTYKTAQQTYRLPAHVQFGTAAGVKGPPSSPDSIVSSPITFKSHSITFYADGVIKPGAIYLTDTNKSCTYALSCAVAQVSYLRKYQYNNGWQIIS